MAGQVSTLGGTMSESGSLPFPRVTGVILDSDICAAHEACTMVCPEVFKIDSGVVALNEDAERYYLSKAAQILEAEAMCPVDAIEVLTDPPRPPVVKPPPVELRGRTLAEKLRYARGERVVTVRERLWEGLRQLFRFTPRRS
jgi:ferredoxin